MAGKSQINMNEISKHMFVDIRVTGVKSFRIRTWVAIQLLKLAAFIMPMNCSVEVE